MGGEKNNHQIQVLHLHEEYLLFPPLLTWINGWNTFHMNKHLETDKEWLGPGGEGRSCSPTFLLEEEPKLHFSFLSGSGCPANECDLQQEELWLTLRSLQCGLCRCCALPESLPRASCGCVRGLSFLHSGSGHPAGTTSMPWTCHPDCRFHCRVFRNLKTAPRPIVTPWGHTHSCRARLIFHSLEMGTWPRGELVIEPFKSIKKSFPPTRNFK